MTRKQVCHKCIQRFKALYHDKYGTVSTTHFQRYLDMADGNTCPFSDDATVSDVVARGNAEESWVGCQYRLELLMAEDAQ